MKISSRDSVLTTFWLLSVYQYFPVSLIGEGEIYPWYAIPAFLYSSKRIQTIFVITVICAFVLTALNPVLLVALIQILCSILACSYIVQMHPEDQQRSLKIIYKILIFLFLLMFLQRVIPQFANIIPELLTSREGRGIDHRTGGVRGIAPEPSYMAASMLSLWICASYLNGYRLTVGKNLLFAFSVFFTGSLLGLIGVVAHFIFLGIQQIKTNLTTLLRLTVKREFLFLILILIVAVSILYYLQPKGIVRLIAFAVDIVSESKVSSVIQSIIKAEEQLKSARLSELLSAFSLDPGLVFTGEYDKSFSVFGQIGAFVSPFHFVLYAFILLRIRFMFEVLMLGFSVLFGPVSMIGFTLIICAAGRARRV